MKDAVVAWFQRRPRLLRWGRRGLVVLGVVAVVVHVMVWLVPLPERLQAKGAQVVQWNDGSAAHVFLTADGKWRMDVDVDTVDDAYIKALLAREDKRFADHLGVDPWALLRAVWLNVSHGEVVSGASTLTMQLVRVLEPRPRTLSSKVVEAFRAYQLEWHLDKRDILQAYLTFIPFGKNVEGVEAASLSYFGHPASSLDEAEIAALLAVPQSPTRRHPRAANVERLHQARQAVAEDLTAKGVFPLRRTSAGADVNVDHLDVDHLAAIAAAPVQQTLRPFPRHVPHTAQKLRRERPQQQHIHTTLRKELQLRLRDSVDLHQYALTTNGIHNAAVVVVDHQDHEIVALVGNLDFFDDEHDGQMVAYDAPRSPGSALKPFLFAQALHDGAHLADHWVLDVPADYAGYSPKNYDGTFDGMVRLDAALSRSLNVPFVQLLHEQGVEPFVERLSTLGVSHLSSTPGHYGLASAIGALEVSPLELAGLYATLSNNGVHAPLRLLVDDDTEQTPQEVFHPAATWLTREVLSRRERPDFPSRRRLAGVPSGIYWKTGTSFGNHDAWTAGGNRRFTTVVWLGNLSMTSSSALVGAEVAGPLFFDVMEALPDDVDDDPRPDGLIGVEVCALSGHLPSDACPHRKLALAIEDRVPTKTCAIHDVIEVDADTGKRVNASCRGDADVEQRHVQQLPVAARRFLRREHSALPAWAKRCEAPAGDAPVIVHPPQGQVAVMAPGIPASQQSIPLRATASSESVAWFVDGVFLGQRPVAEELWWEPSTGQHEVVVVDSAGQSAKHTLRVRALQTASLR
mgnify:CR=1 FL=1